MCTQGPHRQADIQCIGQSFKRVHFAECRATLRSQGGHTTMHLQKCEGEGFFKNQIFIYLAVLGLSFGMWDLLSLSQHAGSLVAAWEF